jgi:hypothetical protein
MIGHCCHHRNNRQGLPNIAGLARSCIATFAGKSAWISSSFQPHEPGQPGSFYKVDKRDHEMVGRILGIGLSSLAIVVPAMAVEPPLAPSRSASFDDLKLATKIKSAISADPALATTNLFVAVNHGAVSIQGPVVDAKARERIEGLTKAVPGVVSVQVNCFELPNPDALAKAVHERMNGQPVPKSDNPNHLAPRPGSLPSVAMAPRQTMLTATREVVTNRPMDDALPPLPTQPVTIPSTITSSTPVIEPLPPAPLTPRPYPTIASPNVPMVPIEARNQTTPVARHAATGPSVSMEELAFAVLDLRAGDQRFRRLSATIVDGVVTIQGSGEGMSDFMAAIRRLPGVSDVKSR